MKLGISYLVWRLIVTSISVCVIHCLKVHVFRVTWPSLIFGKQLISWKQYKIRHSYNGRLTGALSNGTNSNDFDWQWKSLFCFKTFLTRGKAVCINWNVFTCKSESNFSCLIQTEGLFKVIGSHVHCKRGNILETVQDRYVVTTNKCKKAAVYP